MIPTEAQKILETLADGIDPATGELLPDDGPFGNPQVIRALFMAVNALKASSAKLASVLPAQAGKAWTEEENQRLKAGFESGKAVVDLAREHERSRNAISSRLVRLGCLQIDYKKTDKNRSG